VIGSPSTTRSTSGPNLVLWCRYFKIVVVRDVVTAAVATLGVIIAASATPVVSLLQNRCCTRCRYCSCRYSCCRYSRCRYFKIVIVRDVVTAVVATPIVATHYFKIGLYFNVVTVVLFPYYLSYYSTTPVAATPGVVTLKSSLYQMSLLRGVATPVVATLWLSLLQSPLLSGCRYSYHCYYGCSYSSTLPPTWIPIFQLPPLLMSPLESTLSYSATADDVIPAMMLLHNR
jgi:hypothetical protein